MLYFCKVFNFVRKEEKVAPQVNIPCVRSGWIRAWYSCSKVFWGSTCFSFHNISTDHATLSSKTLICSLKEKLSVNKKFLSIWHWTLMSL